MAYDLNEVLKSLRGKGSAPRQDNGQQVSWWKKPGMGQPATTTAFRLYRFERDGQKVACATAKNHNAGTPQKPNWVPCLGEDCSICGTWRELRQKARMDELNKKAYFDQADQIRAQSKYTFVGVPVAQPLGFQLLDVSEGCGRKIFLAAAKEAGWIGGYPSKDATDEQLADFQAKTAEGLDGLCGPTGRDVAITVNPLCAVKSDWYTVDVVRGTAATLTFLEDGTVPDPQVIRDRVDAARARKS